MNQLPADLHEQIALPTIQHVAATPLVTREKFAQLVGIEPGVVLGWCNKGYIPTVPMGRHSLVNVALLSQFCLAQEGGAS